MIHDPPRTLAQALDTACALWADRPALVSRHGNLTYGALDAAAQRLSVAYGVLGIKPGDRIACSVSNRPEALIALAGAWGRGAAHVGIDHGSTARELLGVIERTGARVLVYEPPRDGDPLAGVNAVRAAQPELQIVLVGDAPVVGCRAFAHLTAGTGEAVYDCAPRPQDTALVFISSGTTGTPKATLGFHGNLAARWHGLGGWLGFGPDDAHLAQLPLSHGFGMMMAVAALLQGGRLVMLERFGVDAALDAIARERVTVLGGAPTHFRLLLDRLVPERHDVGSLRLGVGTAAAFPAALVRDIWARLGVRFTLMYGSSEGIGFATTDPDDIRLGSVGRPAPGSVRVVDASRRPVRLGETGELAFSRRVFPVQPYGDEANGGEWFYSGDRGRVDADGRLYVYGRLTHQIDRGGLKVDPVEVEAALLDLPCVVDGAVLGRPDRVLGEVVCACIVPTGEEPRPRLGEVREQMGGGLAPHKLPDELHTLGAIPRTALGKVNLPRLREVLERTPHLVERRTPPVSR